MISRMPALLRGSLGFLLAAAVALGAIPVAAAAAAAKPSAPVKPAKGAPNVTISISVSGAKLFVDGAVAEEQAGQSVALALATGEHALKIVAEGFVAWEGAVTAPAAGGAPVRVDVLLKPAPIPEPAASPTVAVPAATNGASAPARKAPPAIRIALYDFEAKPGIDNGLAALITEAALAEVRKIDRTSAIGMVEVREMLSFEARRQLVGCDASECLAELGGALGVDELVTGSLAVLGDSRLLTVKRIDMKRAAMKAAATRRLQAGNGEEFLAAMGGVFEELYPDYPLREGRKRGVSDAIVARLHPPPLKPWMTITTGVLATAGLVTAGVFGILARDAQSEVDRLRDLAVSEGVQGTTWNEAAARVESRALAANVSFGVGLALTAACVVEALFFTQWDAAASPAGSGSAGDAPSLRFSPAGISGRF